MEYMTLKIILTYIYTDLSNYFMSFLKVIDRIETRRKMQHNVNIVKLNLDA
jgi:hypothetical protein